MDCVIFIGIQATGKSTFYKERFFRTHLHINLDMLRTRHREQRFLETCFETKTSFVVDNTNLSRKIRANYIGQAKTHEYRVIGYYFQSKLADALQRNVQRLDDERIPDKGIYAAATRLEQPSQDEGFDELWYVCITDSGFLAEVWNDAL